MIREVACANKQYFCLKLLMKFDSLRLLQMQSYGVLVEQNLNGQQFFQTIGDNSLKFGSPSASTVIPKSHSGRSMGISGKLKVSEGDTEMRASGFVSSPCNITRKMVTTNIESSTVIASANPLHHAFDIDKYLQSDGGSFLRSLYQRDFNELLQLSSLMREALDPLITRPSIFTLLPRCYNTLR